MWTVLLCEYVSLLALLASKSSKLSQCDWLTTEPLICIFLHFPLLIRWFRTMTNRSSHLQVLNTSVIWQALWSETELVLIEMSVSWCDFFSASHRCRTMRRVLSFSFRSRLFYSLSVYRVLKFMINCLCFLIYQKLMHMFYTLDTYFSRIVATNPFLTLSSCE